MGADCGFAEAGQGDIYRQVRVTASPMEGARCRRQGGRARSGWGGPSQGFPLWAKTELGSECLERVRIS